MGLPVEVGKRVGMGALGIAYLAWSFGGRVKGRDEGR